MATHIEHLALYARKWQEAQQGNKGAVIETAAKLFGLSRQTVYRKFNTLVNTTQRKRRSDFGKSSINREELLLIASTALEHSRKNGKMLLSLEQNVETLRANGLIKAERIDTTTGEVIPVSMSTIQRALKQQQLHPSQLLQPLPATRMRSEHPNHVWQIDPSRCVMAYLPSTGLTIMDEKEYYKNKPANQMKAIKEALWRYVIVDHASGWIYVEYVTGGETAENITSVLMNAMLEREGEAMHGIPKILMLDAGSANTSGMLKNLCKSLRIHLKVNEPGNPRSKGSVEKGNDLVERSFESVLKTLPANKVDTLAKINFLAKKWRTYFNSHACLLRHGMTRTSAWLRIKSHELIEAPSLEIMQNLALTAPEERKVSTFLTISYKGQEYDVSEIPGVLVGERITICHAPTRDMRLQAIVLNKDGSEEYHILDPIQKGEYGFDVTAPVIGESYASKRDTQVSRNLKEIEMLATDTKTLEAAEAIRKTQKKGKSEGFLGGRYDPLAPLEQAPEKLFIPRKGTEHELSKQKVVMPLMTVMQSAKALRIELGEWEPRYYDWVQAHYPNGIREDEVQQVASELKTFMDNNSNVLQFKKAM